VPRAVAGHAARRHRLIDAIRRGSTL
jgi:hypothetical protein